jgi:hypothetical protein
LHYCCFFLIVLFFSWVVIIRVSQHWQIIFHLQGPVLQGAWTCNCTTMQSNCFWWWLEHRLPRQLYQTSCFLWSATSKYPCWWLPWRNILREDVVHLRQQASVLKALNQQQNAAILFACHAHLCNSSAKQLFSKFQWTSGGKTSSNHLYFL